MKKIFIVLFVFCSITSFSQKWTEKEIETELPRECTVITKEQFERLLKQYEEDHKACTFYYYDVLELETHTRPIVTGKHYLLIRTRTFSGLAPVLAYGNSETGRMEIWFTRGTDIKVGSSEYTQKFNQLVKRVNGE